MGDDVDQIDVLLAAGNRGDEAARRKLFELVYDEMRAVAARSRFVAPPGYTLQATALANEAFLRLAERFPDLGDDDRDIRSEFFRTVALVMRSILRSGWRTRTSQKKGGDRQRQPLDDVEPALPSIDIGDGIALDDALDRLERYNARWYQVVAYRYLCGRTVEEVAVLTGVSPTTVKSDWMLARAWLRREIDGGGS